MRRLMLIVAVVAAVGIGPAVPPMAAADSLVGQLVESACYAKQPDKAKSAAHTKCAMACAQKGHRLALVTADGEVYRVVGALTGDNNARLVPLMNRMVVMTGTVGDLNVATVDADLTAPLTIDGVASDGLASDSLASDPVAGDSLVIGDPLVGSDSLIRQIEKRRPSGTEEGIVAKQTIRRGDFREGDVKAGVERVIDAFSVELAPIKLP
jgi:hypothetical protein